MNLEALRAGDVVDLAVRVMGRESLNQIKPYQPVDLHPLGVGQLALSQDGTRVAVSAIGRDAIREVESLGRPECRLSVLSATDGVEAIVRVWTFGRGLLLHREVVHIHMSEPVLVGIAERNDGPVTAEVAHDWLENNLSLPARSPGLRRFIARIDESESALGSAFTLVGVDVELDVRQIDRTLQATRLAPRRQDSALATVLVESAIGFGSDLSTGHNESAPLAALLAEGGYLRRWSRYNEVEFQEEEELAERVGECGYSSAEVMPTGAWRFQLSGASDFLTQLAPGMPVAAVGEAALVFGRKRSRFTGEVEFVRQSDNSVDVRPLSSSETPALVGKLRYALGGSSTSYQRRLDAARRLATGAVGIPELGPILEMRSSPARSVERRLRWDSPAVRAVFGGSAPTDAQKRAIEVALNTPDIAVVQGPPGTGKTKVIAAIAARVAEESGESGAARQVLLTSYQHDAVDNVASRTTVFGLPSVKEGRGERGGSWLQAWRQDRLRHAAELFNKVDQGEIAELRTWITERREAYFLAPVSSDSAGDLLDDVAQRAEQYLPARLIDELSSTSARLRAGRSGIERDRGLLASIRALRTTAEAHADDGPNNARRLLRRLEKQAQVRPEDLGPLELAAESEELSQDGLQTVLELKDRLLDTYGLTAVETLTPTRNEDVLRLLSRSMEAIDERMRQEGQGIAAVLARFVHDLETDPVGVEVALGSYAAVVAATCQASASLAARPDAVADSAPVNTVIVDEAARANPLDLQIPLCLASRRVVLVGDQRQLPHIVDGRIAQAVSSSELEATELEESLFGRLFRFLVAERESGRPDRVVTLTSQFRMHPLLGDFVSRSFYEPYGESLQSPLSATEFDHQLPGYEGRCAAWIDIPRSRGRERRVGTSRQRDIEAEVVATEVHRMMEADPQLTFGVITFYRAQVERILEELLLLGVAGYDPDSGKLDIYSSNWRYTTDRDGQVVERIRVGTVDAFQGKEFDVVFLSTVRTPDSRVAHQNAAFGHLVIENRLCVSMSRQRRLLVAVGDREGLLTHPAADEHIRPLRDFARLCDEESS